MTHAMIKHAPVRVERTYAEVAMAGAFPMTAQVDVTEWIKGVDGRVLDVRHVGTVIVHRSEWINGWGQLDA